MVRTNNPATAANWAERLERPCLEGSGSLKLLSKLGQCGPQGSVRDLNQSMMWLVQRQNQKDRTPTDSAEMSNPALTVRLRSAGDHGLAAFDACSATLQRRPSESMNCARIPPKSCFVGGMLNCTPFAIIS